MNLTLEKLRQKINKDVIAIGIIIIISIVLYGKYIATPFGDHDTWFERIAYGGYDFKELPQPLQKLEIPTDFSEYSEYREKVVGRLFGSVLPTYTMIKIFGDWVLCWRIVLFLLIFVTYWLLYSILKRFHVPYWNRFFCLLFYIILLNRYFYKPISIIIGLSHLFFLIAIFLELNNSGFKKFKIRNSIFGAFFIFVSLFIRELSATSVLGLLAILLFWHCEHENTETRFKLNWRRLAPYAFFAAFYFGLYLRMSLQKVDFAYSNMISWQIDFSYFKRVFLLLIKWIGLESSLYLGLFLTIIIGSVFLLTLVKARYLPGKMAVFTLIFGIVLLAPTLLLIPFLTHRTGSFTLQYLAVMIVFSFLIGYMENSAVSRLFKKVSHIFLCIILSSLLVIYALEAKQKAENYCVDACVTEKTVEWAAIHIPKNGIVELDGFTFTSAYSFISDIFIAGRRDDIQYYRKENTNKKGTEKYYEYLLAPLRFDTLTKRKPDLIIKKNPILAVSDNTDKLQDREAKVFEKDIKNYSFSYLLLKKAYRGINQNEQPGKISNFISKFLFGIKISSLEKQLLKGIDFRIQADGSFLEVTK